MSMSGAVVIVSMASTALLLLIFVLNRLFAEDRIIAKVLVRTTPQGCTSGTDTAVLLIHLRQAVFCDFAGINCSHTVSMSCIRQ